MWPQYLLTRIMWMDGVLEVLCIGVPCVHTVYVCFVHVCVCTYCMCWVHVQMCGVCMCTYVHTRLCWTQRRPVHCPRLRLLARGVGCFLHCQLPVDKEHKTQLRVTPNALGFVRDTDTLGGYHPTKAAEQGLKSLTNCQVTSPTMPSRKTLPTSVTLCATPRIM